ncbi:hypothetical protein VB508_24110, partial [Vibrio parahaemolyticus]|uniref:hypothetical protein n=1 Tax=Vibrio parahaemolyticus TaxID=670 RepID=UPI002B1FF40A
MYKIIISGVFYLVCSLSVQAMEPEELLTKIRFIADKRELKTKTVVSDRVLSPNKTYTNYRFHV